MEIVTANGQHLLINKDSHPDLFWAARGAGPGFPAIVTRLYLRTRPLLEMYQSLYFYPVSLFKKVLQWAINVCSPPSPSLPFPSSCHILTHPCPSRSHQPATQAWKSSASPPTSALPLPPKTHMTRTRPRTPTTTPNPPSSPPSPSSPPPAPPPSPPYNPSTTCTRPAPNTWSFANLPPSGKSTNSNCWPARGDIGIAVIMLILPMICLPHPAWQHKAWRLQRNVYQSPTSSKRVSRLYPRSNLLLSGSP